MPFKRIVSSSLRVKDVCYSTSQDSYGRIVDKHQGVVVLQTAHKECILYSCDEKVYELNWNNFITTRILPDQTSIRDGAGGVWIALGQVIHPVQNAVHRRLYDVADDQPDVGDILCDEHLGEQPSDLEILSSMEVTGGTSCSDDAFSHISG